MNKQLINFYLLFNLIIFLISCSHHRNTEGLVVIHPDKFVEKELLLSEYSNEIKYIKISDEKLFRATFHMEFCDDFIFLGTDQGILKYDHQGNFKGLVGNIGPGPMEYTGCLDFTLDNKRQHIFVRDYPYIKIFTFAGEYINAIDVSQIQQFVKMIYQDEKIYLVPHLSASPKAYNKYFWITIDLNGRVLSAKENHDVYFAEEGMSYYGNFIYNYNSFVCYWNHYNDTIFSISGDSFQAKYIWGKGDFRLTPEKNSSNEDGACLHLRTILETDRILYMQYYRRKAYNICIYDKINGTFANMRIRENDRIGFINDLDGGLPLRPSQVLEISNEPYFIEEISPSDLLDYSKSHIISDEKLKKFVATISEDDNPILVISKIK